LAPTNEKGEACPEENISLCSVSSGPDAGPPAGPPAGRTAGQRGRPRGSRPAVATAAIDESPPSEQFYAAFAGWLRTYTWACLGEIAGRAVINQFRALLKFIGSPYYSTDVPQLDYYWVLNRLFARLSTVSVNSAGCERLFSLMGHFSTRYRSRLLAKNLVNMSRYRESLKKNEEKLRDTTITLPPGVLSIADVESEELNGESEGYDHPVSGGRSENDEWQDSRASSDPQQTESTMTSSAIISHYDAVGWDDPKHPFVDPPGKNRNWRRFNIHFAMVSFYRKEAIDLTKDRNHENA